MQLKKYFATCVQEVDESIFQAKIRHLFFSQKKINSSLYFRFEFVDEDLIAKLLRGITTSSGTQKPQVN